ncbi:Elongation factor G, mitochondrial, partial [Tulasnella sp. 427]
HVDFTIEVERALRVLDGAVLVLCAFSGVQSQTITVDRQMRRYNVPRISFINKMDRAGANPYRIVNQIRQKLRMPAALAQVPNGTEDEFKGVFDLVRMKAIYNKGIKGEEVTETDEIPASVMETAQEKRAELIKQLAEVDDELAELFLEEAEINVKDIVEAMRRATIARKFTPVFIGSAIKNTGVQPLLDGVCAYLPTPSEAEVKAIDVSKPANAPLVPLSPAAEAPLVGLAFKLEEGRFGQLTYMRVYQGTLRKGAIVYNARTGKKVKVPRLVRMHSNNMEDVAEIGPDLHVRPRTRRLSGHQTLIKPTGNEAPNFSRALNRFQKEDPPSASTSTPRAARPLSREWANSISKSTETITQRADFAYRHKKQTGGAGQFGRLSGFIEPIEADEETGDNVAFENWVTGGNIPAGYIPAVKKGFRDALEKGSLAGCPVSGIRMILQAAIGAFRECYMKARPCILGPIMSVEIVAPTEFQGDVTGSVNQRRGTIIDTDVREDEFTVQADVSLSDMFGFSSQLRGLTQGKGEFSMEYETHQPVLPHIQQEMAAEYQRKLQQKK